ncbi:amino acid adenylation domain-containing protein [Lentzea sp. NPDC005914]|uniref:amino acid adenylation domain-containing protein n=1 Tax=Lentzea sp. NPDC005914 TaxID=3154572 RepID=UPI0033DEBC43
MTRLVVPQLGEGIVEVRIVHLLKKPGDRVARDEVVYEMEHDKAAVEIESPADGVLAEWLVREGDVVPIGAAVAVILPVDAATKVRVPPKTRLFARRLGVADEDLSSVPAAGTVLMPEDVQAFVDAQVDPSVAQSARQQSLNAAMRRAGAEVVPAAVAIPLDAALVDAAVGDGFGTPFQAFAHRVAQVAALHPAVRSRRVADDRVLVHDVVNLGVAVSTEDDELTVAVVPGASSLSPVEFAERLGVAVEEARAGRSQADGSVSLILSHLGDDSATFAVPVVVPPAVATLFLGARAGGVRQMVLAFDHSVFNGHEAARFLAAVRDSFAPAQVEVPVSSGTAMERVAAIASSVFGHAIDPERPLGEQGMDSAGAMRLVREIGEAFGTKVPVTAVWRYPRLRDLVESLGDVAPVEVAPVVVAEPVVVEPAVAWSEPVVESNGEIAVIGMACTVPGASDLDEFWSLLERGECRIGDVPPSRAADLGSGFKAALLDRIDLFDAEFFGITPRQAASMDPQQRMLLELSLHALQHAGIEPNSVEGKDVGVFVGACGYDYRERVLGAGAADGYATTGTFPAFLANRVSHFYDFTGPSLTVDTACSAALTAVATAMASLRSGDCGMALVGAANLLSSSFNTTAFGQAGMLSPQGQSRVFDDAADGFVRGEGAGWVLLKPLSQARADGDRVLAVLRGAAVNHGGRAASLTSPNPAAQTRLIRRALSQAGLDAGALGYVEAHGTGTALGDPIEIDGIAGALDGATGGGPDGKLWVGSVKSNIGHLEGAAGIVGLIKVILSLQHGVIPRSVGFSRLNSDISTDGTPIAVASAPVAWAAEGAARVAAVSAFGFGGSNGHVIVEEAPRGLVGRAALEPQRFSRSSHWLAKGEADSGVAGVGPVAGQAAVPGVSGVGSLAGGAAVAGVASVGSLAGQVAVPGVARDGSVADHATVPGAVRSEPLAGHAVVPGVAGVGSLADHAGVPGVAGVGSLIGDAAVPGVGVESLGDRATVPGAVRSDPLAGHAMGPGTARGESQAGHAAAPGAVRSEALAEHVVGGQATVPGAALIYPRLGEGPVTLRRVRFQRPVPVSEMDSLTVQDGVVLASGEPCARAERAEFAPLEAVELGSGGESVDLYGLLAARGIEVGNVYRVVGDLKRAGSEATGVVGAPDGDARTRRIAWLDAVLQASHAVLDTSSTLVAAGIDELSWTGEIPAGARVRVCRVGDGVVDIDVPGVLRVRGLRLMAASDVRMLVPRWVAEAVTPVNASGAKVVVHDDVTSGDVHVEDPRLAVVVAAAQDVHLRVGGAGWTEDDVPRLRAWLNAVVAIGRALRESRATVRLVTSGLYEPTPGAALQGALVGAVRSLPLELPGVTVCAVDVEGTDYTGVDTEPCGVGAPLIALRGQRFRQVFADEPVKAAQAFRSGGVYVLFGGAGGIGTEIARHLAKVYSARVLLVGRSATAPELVPGAVYRQADLTRPDEIADVLAFCRKTLGEPDGVVHTVGSVSASLLADLTPSGVDAVLATKVSAAIELRRQLKDKLLVLSSSVAGLFGSEGGLNYAAANSFLGHYAAAVGGPVHVLDWGLWRDTGLARKYSSHVLRSYPGLADFRPADGIAALEAAISNGHGHAVVLAGKPDALQPHASPNTSAAKRLDEYARGALAARMRELSLTDFSMDFASAAGLLGVVPAHRRLLAAVLDVLASGPNGSADRAALLADHPDLEGHVELLDRVLASYGPILRGDVGAADVLFPGGDLSGVSAIYSGNQLFDPVNASVAEAVAAEATRISATRRPRILEIGAGVGGTTQFVLDALDVEVDYTYTDLSRAFLHHGTRRFGDAVTTALFNVEQDPAAQGFEPGSFDIVVGSNVVHATRDIATTVANVAKVLVPGGRMVLGEMVVPATVYTVIFGVTDGWWRYVDPESRMPHGPLLDVARWDRLLSEVDWRLESATHTGDPGATAVLTCVAPGEEVVSVPKANDLGIAEGLRDIVRKLIGNPGAEVPGDASWQELGIDSLLNNELVAEVSSTFVEISSVALFEHRTLDLLARHLADRVEVADVPATTGVAADEAPIVVERSEAPIAIVGVAGRYPGAANLDEFWKLLRDGVSTVREVPADRWDWRVARTVTGGYARWGCFLDDWDGFDAALFKIPPRDAAVMDPQERLFLEVAWEAFETAGYSRRGLTSRRVGVFAGVTANSHVIAGRDARLNGADNAEYAVTALASAANRVSHAFDLSGPSMTVDTMCSSSLTALHLACKALRDGDAEMALVGGVNLYLHPDRFAGLCALGMPSRGDRTKAFGAGGDGFVPGEGVGAVVLKRLDDAEADGDTVLAVIRGTGVNHGGGTAGYTVPNPLAQAELISATLASAGVAAAEIGYVEAHGTGTALGDPIEMRALAIALGDAREVRVGSVKSNIGHGEAAAGIAGLTKAILQLQHRELVPSLHAEPPNPRLELEGTPLRVQHNLERWAAEGLRRATVSSFGAGGANAHVVLEEYPQAVSPSSDEIVKVTITAPDAMRLAETARRLADIALEVAPADMAHTLHVGREPWPHRATITARDRSELAGALNALANGSPHPSVDLTGEIVQPRPARRIPLPTTPFARVERVAPAVSGLPLVGAVSAPQTRTASLTLTSKSRLLADHVVDGEPLLPGAVHPELVYETLLAAGRSPYEVALDALTWPAPAAGSPLNLRVTVEEKAFEVGSDGRVIAEGSIVERNTVVPQPYDVRELARRLSGGTSAESFYGTFAQAGFGYGRLFRTVLEARMDGTELVARFALPEGEDPDGRQVFHPAVLDAACQSAAYRLLTEDITRRYRPIAIDRLIVHQPVSGEGFLHVRQEDTSTFDITVVGTDGAVQAEVIGFTVHSGTKPANDGIEPARIEEIKPLPVIDDPVTAYRLEWVPVPSRTTPSGPVAVLGDGPVAQHTPRGTTAGAKEILVDLTWLGDGFGATPENSTACRDLPIEMVFGLLRDLVRDREIDGARVHVLTAADTEPSPLLHAVHGLVRTVAGETARFGIRLVTIDRGWLVEPSHVAGAVIGDEDFTPASWVRLGHRRREVATLVAQPEPRGKLELRKDGSYLLVGGLGGFGREIAKSILAAGARPVLVGRSAPGTVTLGDLRPLYRQCDVTDLEQVSKLAEELPDVRGIIYLAGVLRDGFLRTKTDEAVREVCDAKILGATNVDTAFAHHRLDFFAFASSLAALAGNQGQSDYAFANGFLDGFAAVRAGWVSRGLREGRTLSVGWPILSGHGMSPSPESLRYLEETLGLTPMPMARATDELWRLLGADNRCTHLALVHGDRDVWESALKVEPLPAPSEDRDHGLVQWLREKLSRAIGVSIDLLDPDRELLAYGVDSVVLMRLNRALESDIGRLPMTTLMDSPTLGVLADRLRAEHADQLGGITTPAEPEPYQSPASGLTERLMGIWFADQTAAPAAPYSISMAWQLRSDVDRAALGRAVDMLVRRHAVLASTVTPNGGELDFTPAPKPPTLQARHVGEPVGPLLRAEAERRFRLGDEPPLRAILWLPDGEPPVLQVVTHHLVVDGKSAELIRDELEALYEGRALPEPVPFSVALQEEHAVAPERLVTSESFWRDRLAETPSAPLFGGDPADVNGSHREYRLPLDLSIEDATPFVTLLAAFSLAVARTTGHDEFLVAVPTYGRSRAEFDTTIGCFVNSVPLRVRVERDLPVREWLAGLHDEVREALANAELPYPKIVGHCAQAPKVTLAFQNWQRGEREAGLLSTLVHQRGQQGHFDLGLEVTDTGDGVEILANHRTAALSGDEVDRFVDDLRRMVVELNRGADKVGDLMRTDAGTLVGRFREVVAATPDAIAVEDATRKLTYAELDALSRKVATEVAAVAEPGEPVAVLLDRDARLPAVLLGVLAAGTPYVPLDAAYPPERLEMVLAAAGCRVAVVADTYPGLLPDNLYLVSVEELEHAAAKQVSVLPAPGDLAYLMFTSGSTGRPKGVGVTHGNVVHTLDAIASTIGWTASDRLLAVTTVCFDISVLEIFLPLISGGTAVIANRETVIDARKFATMLADKDISVLQATPAGWQLLLDGAWQGRPGLVALCGGEALPENLAAALTSRTKKLWNVYGPTEATIWSTIAEIDGPVHLGEPIGATDLVVTPDGELWIGGPAVAVGYWRQPDLTAQRFCPHPASPETGGRYFRTGDLVRRDDEGRLVFVGRADNQVKVRGHRVELGEIETVLDAHPLVIRTIVVLTGEGADARLVAVVVPRPGAAVDLEALRRLGEQRLPSWMLPDRVLVVEGFPLTPNGKVDRKAVAALVTGAPPPREAPSADGVGGSVDVAATVAKAWASVLGGEEPPRDRKFFDLGGNSLLLGRLFARLAPLFPAASLEVADLFARPTINDQAELINQRTGGTPPVTSTPPAPRSRRELRRALRLGDAG